MRLLSDVSLRSLTAVAIVLGLLSLVFVVYFRDGYDATASVFMLTQGVLLGAFGWLYGSHAAERAEELAVRALADRRVITARTERFASEIEVLEADADRARRIVAAMLSTPGMSEKVNELLTREGVEDP